MKRLWLGVGILAVLLAVSVCVTLGMDRVHDGIAADLEAAQAAAIDEDWDKALELADRAAEKWERTRRFTAAVADHGPMDEVDRQFAALKASGRLRETADFAAACAELAVQARAMGDSHALTWWNLL